MKLKECMGIADAKVGWAFPMTAVKLAHSMGRKKERKKEKRKRRGRGENTRERNKKETKRSDRSRQRRDEKLRKHRKKACNPIRGSRGLIN